MKRIVLPFVAVVAVVVTMLVVRPADADGRFAPTKSPAITGTVKPGSTLTVSPGTWSGSPAHFDYTWLRNGEDTVVSRRATYKVVTADAGQFLTVLVTAEDANSESTSSADSERPALTVKVPAHNAAAPKVAGTTKVGRVLTSTGGTWTGPGYTYRRQWLRNGVPIAKATGQAYKLTSADRGKRIQVRVTGTKPGWPSVVVASTATKAVAK